MPVYQMFCEGCNRRVVNEQVHTRCPQCIEDTKELIRAIDTIRATHPEVYGHLRRINIIKKLYYTAHRIKKGKSNG